MIDPNEPVLIVGAGTFGLSTALFLLRSGHRNVTLIDPYHFPSDISAGNDVNKIVQTYLTSRFYTDLALEALELWRNDPIYRDAFHEVGIVYGAKTKEPISEIKERYYSLSKRGLNLTWYNNPKDFQKFYPISSGSEVFKDWQGFYQNSNCGWANAALALKNVAKECKRLGVKFIKGEVSGLIYGTKNNKSTIFGVKTIDGLKIFATKTVICAGANSVKLLNFKGQLLAKCWTVAHIKLTHEESKALRKTPVLLNIEEGFFFEPTSNNELKVCNEFPGYVNMDPNSKDSLPVYLNKIPIEAERQIRGFLRQVLPEIAERPFSLAKICWCTDTPNRHFLFGDHPEFEGLVLGTGDSGQGFKYMPVIGNYIGNVVLHGADVGLDDEKLNTWKWRPDTAINRDILGDNQNRWGGSNVIKDLSKIHEWTNGKLGSKI